MKFDKIPPLLSALLILIFASCATVEEGPLAPLSDSEMQILKYMGGKVLDDGNLAIGNITIHRRNQEISFPAKVNINEGDLEVLICTPSGRAHESLLVSSVDPYKLQLALLLIGAENGTRTPPEKKKEGVENKGEGLAQGTLIDIMVKPEKMTGFPIEQWLKNKKTDREKIQEGWVFVGSSYSADKQCLATEEGNIVNIWNFGNTILDNPSTSGDTDDLFVAYTKRMFPYETPVKVVMKKREKKF